MSDVNFKLLHIFIAIADNKSFRQASEKLNRSQSAVSMQIKQLEEQVGVALFHRTTRRVELTAEGVKLLTFARRALGEWENGLREIREAVDIQRGTLSFACIPTIAATILPRALQVFQASYPGISISLRELAAADLRMSVDLTELCAYPVLLNSKSTALRIMLDRALAVRDLHMDIKFEVAHTHTLIACRRGNGSRHPAENRLAYPAQEEPAGIANPGLTRTVSIVTLRGQSLSPAGRALTGAVQKFLKRQTTCSVRIPQPYRPAR